jgi:hypothetical protein
MCASGNVFFAEPGRKERTRGKDLRFLPNQSNGMLLPQCAATGRWYWILDAELGMERISSAEWEQNLRLEEIFTKALLLRQVRDTDVRVRHGSNWMQVGYLFEAGFLTSSRVSK